LVNTFRKWYSTVRGLMNSSAPISGFVFPSAAQLSGANRHRTAGATSRPAARGRRLARFFLDNEDMLNIWARRFGESAVHALADELRRLPWREGRG
jgi:hypothetical protein